MQLGEQAGLIRHEDHQAVMYSCFPDVAGVLPKPMRIIFRQHPSSLQKQITRAERLLFSFKGSSGKLRCQMAIRGGFGP